MITRSKKCGDKKMRGNEIMRMTKLTIPALMAATLSLNAMADEVYYTIRRE